MNIQAYEAVQRGAALLDEHQPDWVSRFVKNGLKNGFDLGSETQCVLGNVFFKKKHLNDDNEETGFSLGIEALGISPTLSDQILHGFNYSFDLPLLSAQEITEAWQQEILYRLALKNGNTMAEKINGIVKMFKKAFR